MQRNSATLLGLALGLAALAGCVQAPPPQAICPAFAAPLPVAPPPAAVVLPPTPVWTPPRHHVVVVTHRVHHVVVRRHWAHRDVVRTVYRSPYCGSVPHPCDVDHRVVPEQ